jgi:hypothetical protein
MQYRDSKLKQRRLVEECVTFLIRIREIPVSNLGPEAGYSDWSEFSEVFLSPVRKTIE